MISLRPTLLAGAALLTAGCAQLPPQRFELARSAAIDAAIGAVVAARGMPGAQFRLERAGMVYEHSYGRLSYDDGAAAVGPDTVYDIASLTKVVATAPAVLLLAEQGKLELDAPLLRYFPECGNGGKEAITLRHLLTHSSGLPSGLPALPAWQGDAAAHALACAQRVTHAPGTMFRYSDINFILLGQLVQKVSGEPLEQFARRAIFAPLGMDATGYLPPRAAGIAPTQRAAGAGAHADLAAGQLLQGVVHDPSARRMGGVAGSAGLFSTARDLARFARMLLGGGQLDGVRVLSAASVRLLSTPQSPPGLAELRGLGMDIDSPFARPRGSLYPVGSYGHTGFTGCVLWIDPASASFYVLLSNRVYPDDKSNILPLYGQLGTLAAEAVRAAPPIPAPF
ncbi:MAG: serine hydrolase domain-containing protein [Pseudomonadota bacterium]